MMECVICKKGKTAAGRMTVTLDRENTTIVVRNVPAQICQNCGEEYLDEKTTTRVLQEAQKTATSGTLINIREYIAA